MQIHAGRMLAIATVFAIAAFCTGGGVTASAQYTYDNYYAPTPPQGPPLPGASSQFITVDTFITPEVYGRIDQAISDNNRCYLPAKFGDEMFVADSEFVGHGANRLLMRLPQKLVERPANPLPSVASSLRSGHPTEEKLLQRSEFGFRVGSVQ